MVVLHMVEWHGTDGLIIQAAVKGMDGQDWHGRQLRVQISTESGRNRSGGEKAVTRNLFVANIAPHIKLSELEEFFDEFGKGKDIACIRVVLKSAKLGCM